MPDKAEQLAQRLLALTESQGRCLAKQDWTGFTDLAAIRQTVMAELVPLATGRRDLAETLTKAAQLDEAHAHQLAAAHDDLGHEVNAMRPQQTAVMAYYQGEYQPAIGDARFIDQWD